MQSAFGGFMTFLGKPKSFQPKKFLGGEAGVLIVDDDRDTAGLFGEVLRLVGFTCDIVYSAKEALAHLAVSEPDMILLDMRLGIEIDGVDILQQVRSNPRLDKTRVIVVTAYPGMADTITDLADLVLLKPVEVDQLKELVKRLSSFEKTAARQYFRDEVTGLFNESFFQTRVEHAIERSKRRADFMFAVFVFDITVRHEPGADIESDLVQACLQDVAVRLRRSIRPTDTIARLSGFKFATLHEDLKQPEDVRVIIQRIWDTLAPTVLVGEREYYLAPSLGAALHHKNYQAAGDIWRVAELALVQAREAEGRKIKIIGLPA